MLEQLIKLAQEKLSGISHDIPELTDLDGKQVTEVTSQTLINTIFQQAKKGNFSGLKEMLSGFDTNEPNTSMDQLKEPVSNQLQSRLNISNNTAKQLAIIALPIIMNMLNKRVQNAKSGGYNVDDEMNKMSRGGGGLISNLMSMLGKNQHSKTINTLIQNLITKNSD